MRAQTLRMARATLATTMQMKISVWVQSAGCIPAAEGCPKKFRNQKFSLYCTASCRTTTATSSSTSDQARSFERPRQKPDALNQNR